MSALRVLERALFVLGVTLALWYGFVLARAEYVRRLPVPAPVTIRALPGDVGSPSAGSPSTPRAAPGEWVGRLQAPSIQLNATVLEGSDDPTLRLGAGHIEDTAFPGTSGNVGIAGHRDTVFRPLRRVKVGDALDLTTRDRVYHYRVVSTTIVSPTAVDVLDPTAEPTLTLVTCYPFNYIGHAPRRFIVHAKLLGNEPRRPGAGTD
jgi:sortase A